VIEAIVTDIEGTTSSLSFVKDVLFPYARSNMATFLRQHADAPHVTEQLDAVRAEMGRDLTVDEIAATLKRWIDEDRKVTPLKTLQGFIWEAGYQRGDFQGHIYADAARQLSQWHRQGIGLYVYSSGSVYAQKLLFGHTEFGDLTALFSGYFDTKIGAKAEADSYERIAAEIGVPAGQILFLSDVTAELDAACESGMRTIQLVREGALEPAPRHPQARDFTELDRIIATSDW
jgi:enolase-phosphatase E1